jgi:hypothetical protein
VPPSSISISGRSSSSSFPISTATLRRHLLAHPTSPDLPRLLPPAGPDVYDVHRFVLLGCHRRLSPARLRDREDCGGSPRLRWRPCAVTMACSPLAFPASGPRPRPSGTALYAPHCHIRPLLVALFFCCSSLSHMYQEPQYLRQHHGPLSTPSVVRTSSLSRHLPQQ